MNNTSTNNRMILQDAFFLIEKLASLCSTEGIEGTTKEIANMQIRELLAGPVKSSVTELKILAAGIVTLV